MLDAKRWSVIGWLALLAAFLVSYYGALAHLAARWTEPDYAHGWLVPLFAGVLLWVRRPMPAIDQRRGVWLAVPCFALALALRFAAAYWYFRLLEPLSLLPCLAGIALLLAGWN